MENNKNVQSERGILYSKVFKLTQLKTIFFGNLHVFLCQKKQTKTKEVYATT